jgi:hypothetical protein
MWFRSLLKSLKSRPSVAPVRRPPRRSTGPRLVVEALEDRSLPSCMVSLAPSEAAPQLVGERITWTATTADCGAAPVYQFSAAEHGSAFHVVRDFSPTNSFAWTPMRGGHLRHQGQRQGRLPGHRHHNRRGGRRCRLAGGRVAGGGHTHL